MWLQIDFGSATGRIEVDLFFVSFVCVFRIILS